MPLAELDARSCSASSLVRWYTSPGANGASSFAGGRSICPCTPPVLQWTTRRGAAAAAASRTCRVPFDVDSRVRRAPLPRFAIGGGDVVDDLAAPLTACVTAAASESHPRESRRQSLASSSARSNARRPHERRDGIAAPNQVPRKMTAREPRRAGDENLHARDGTPTTPRGRATRSQTSRVSARRMRPGCTGFVRARGPRPKSRRRAQRSSSSFVSAAANAAGSGATSSAISRSSTCVCVRRSRRDDRLARPQVRIDLQRRIRSGNPRDARMSEAATNAGTSRAGW